MRKRWIMGVVLAACPLTLAMAAPGDGGRFGLVCSGTETVRYGAQVPQRAVYGIALSIDLMAKRYCYATCSLGQTYPIADAGAAPIRLADVDTPAHRRRMVLDRGTAQLTDDQRIVAGPIVVIRHAVATCTPGAFKEPPAG